MALAVGLLLDMVVLLVCGEKEGVKGKCEKKIERESQGSSF